MAGIFDADFLKGFHLGKAFYANLLRAAKGEPVAYLYGGVRLPKLPEWDETVYPYAIITERTLYVSKIRPYTKESSDGSIWVWAQGEWGDVLHYYLFDNSTSWQGPSADDVAGCKQSDLLWSNKDILDSTGSVSFAGSDPVDIGDGMMGYGGVRLPKLPESRLLSFIYAYTLLGNTYYESYFLQEKPDVVYQPENSLEWYMTLPTPFLKSSFNRSTNEWGELESITTSYNRGAVWANFDIKADDGTLIVAASDPIPVYE